MYVCGGRGGREFGRDGVRVGGRRGYVNLLLVKVLEYCNAVF